MTQTPAIWLFDSDCALCDAGVRATLRWEKTASIHFMAIRSEAGRRLARAHGLDPDDPQSFLFLEDGVGLQGSDALLALLRHLRGPVRLLDSLRILPKPLRDAGYRLIARNRYRWFGRVATCTRPTPATRDRFTL